MEASSFSLLLRLDSADLGFFWTFWPPLLSAHLIVPKKYVFFSLFFFFPPSPPFFAGPYRVVLIPAFPICPFYASCPPPAWKSLVFKSPFPLLAMHKARLPLLSLFFSPLLEEIRRSPFSPEKEALSPSLPPSFSLGRNRRGRRLVRPPSTAIDSKYIKDASYASIIERVRVLLSPSPPPLRQSKLMTRWPRYPKFRLSISADTVLRSDLSSPQEVRAPLPFFLLKGESHFSSLKRKLKNPFPVRKSSEAPPLPSFLLPHKAATLPYFLFRLIPPRRRKTLFFDKTPFLLSLLSSSQALFEPAFLNGYARVAVRLGLITYHFPVRGPSSPPFSLLSLD